MPLTYPIASSAKAALSAKQHARSLAEAKRAANANVALVSDWLRPTKAEHEKLSTMIEEGLRDGFVQVYEAKEGRVVLAVTYWKRAEKTASPSPSAPTAHEDHTDDLYFSKSRTARAASPRTRKPADPRQMDLFSPGGGEGDQASQTVGEDSTRAKK